MNLRSSFHLDNNHPNITLFPDSHSNTNLNTGFYASYNCSLYDRLQLNIHATTYEKKRRLINKKKNIPR